MTTRKELLKRIIRDYRAAGGKWPASTREMAKWAIKTGRYDLKEATIERQCARELAQTLRDERYIDTLGRRVRAKHPAKIFKNGQQVVL